MPRERKEKQDRKSKLKAKSLAEDLPVDEDSAPVLVNTPEEVAVY